ncbi:atlastin-like [Contarinia nasturtii]|uniref:atlastin-like n=1 Tax=Contarinia nasturtii TaxID=265458 RepID=UPI0012D390CE|nr:atlastin-like [Contarinia nasturtii]
MKLALLIANTLLSTGIFCSHGQVDENDDISKGRAIQIISPVNHSFHLNSNDLNPILESDEIKDRHVVVVSIAGAFRKGKSFLLNFFLRYLYAQYKKHDVIEWLESSGNDSVLNGFKWRGGRKPETTGIWMWSEMFTHDFENGEKIVIILLDTQGIFDHQSSIQDCAKTFALSIMLSSVQCYNLMQNFQENDLQNLDLFSEYGRLVMEQTHEKPFQHLVILIRDWPFAYETGYGWSQSVIDELMTSIEEQMPEMREPRQRIRSSFEKISAFLMPYPGTFVAQGTNLTGDLKQIDPEFLKYVKELMPAMFEPKNLVFGKLIVR